MTALAALCVVLAAAVLGWPVPDRRARRRRIPALAGRSRQAPAWAGTRQIPVRVGARRAVWPRPGATAGRLPLAALVVAGAALAAALGGVVAGIVAGVYGALAARTVIRRGAGRARTARRAELLDLLGSAAADLRAGLPAGTALADIPAESADPLLPRVRAAVLLAERTGAPLADVLERIEADARSADRATAASAAQAAGSRATAWLLAGLPAGGIALGYAIGADPLEVLLRTPIGAGCALGAVVLQLGGLGWAGRLIRTNRPAVAS
jgi:tight adherence protein B